jgi:hypothetical protein
MSSACGSVGAPQKDTVTCTDGLLKCGDTCIDPLSDARYCGAIADCTGGNSGVVCEAPAGATAVCNQGTCATVTRASCLELGQIGVTHSDVYVIQPAGSEPLSAYCDMDTDGGGWTLVMKLSTNSNQLTYAAPQWTTTALFNESSLTPNTDIGSSGEAKFAAYNVVSGTELRLSWLDPQHSFLLDGLADRTALALFQAPQLRIAGGGSCGTASLSSDPNFLSTHMRHGKGHQFYGINGTDSGAGATRHLRYGFASNDEGTSAWIPHQAIGGDTMGIAWNAETDCSECGGCYGTAYAPAATAANLWIR